ncbi:unnamed protein product [Plutella xylostella]|uniref:(diamondback moth) hypothetical protein n=1 Tax=Plutella xylostella TaxID=51655 RepID=A0A8S4G8K0_PLUXY|nr:unnamed protein product [Plutella xylostella]
MIFHNISLVHPPPPHSYAVIFMHRQKSLEPFTRHFTGQKLLDMLDIQERGPNTTITVKPDSVDVLAPVLLRYKAAHSAGAILHVAFTTVSEYFWLLRAACESLSALGPRAVLYLAAAVSDFYVPKDRVYFWLLRAACESLSALGPRAVLYLAAAVSDFYVPKDRVPTHKMQSGSGAPVIQLHLVPKMLAPLVNLWMPSAYVVSFKLETDENLLIPKARAALDKYKHKMVVANMLQTRHHRVVLVTPESSQEILLTREEVHAGADIESPLVASIVQLHAASCGTDVTRAPLADCGPAPPR